MGWATIHIQLMKTGPTSVVTQPPNECPEVWLAAGSQRIEIGTRKEVRNYTQSSTQHSSHHTTFSSSHLLSRYLIANTTQQASSVLFCSCPISSLFTPPHFLFSFLFCFLYCFCFCFPFSDVYDDHGLSLVLDLRDAKNSFQDTQLHSLNSLVPGSSQICLISAHFCQSLLLSTFPSSAFSQLPQYYQRVVFFYSLLSFQNDQSRCGDSL